METFLPINHPEAAKSHMVTKVSLASPHETVGSVLQKLQNQNAFFDTVDYTYILDKEGKLEGVVSMKELLNARNEDRLDRLMHKKVAVVHPSTDQEHVAMLAIKQNIKSLPVVDKEHRFLGVVPSDVILNILHWEHVEDVLRLSGIHGKGVHMRSFMKSSAFTMSKMRIPSLLIGLAGGLLTTSIVGYFEQSLEKNILLAFFIPLIVYMSDAVGTQTETILVRTLATEEIQLKKYILREFLVASTIGLVVGGTMFLTAYLWFHSFLIALTIGVSLFMTISIGSIVSILIPWLLAHFKKDPAISGGPFTTVIQDILSLLIYFLVAALILKN